MIKVEYSKLTEGETEIFDSSKILHLQWNVNFKTSAIEESQNATVKAFPESFVIKMSNDKVARFLNPSQKRNTHSQKQVDM